MTPDYNDDRGAGDAVPAPDDEKAEHGEHAEHVDPEHTDEQDFAIRNVVMSNALPNSGQPAAGAIVGSAGRLGMQPETDEEIVGGNEEDRAAAVESEAGPREESGEA